jgi:hypothetical protein
VEEEAAVSGKTLDVELGGEVLQVDDREEVGALARTRSRSGPAVGGSCGIRERRRARRNIRVEEG